MKKNWVPIVGLVAGAALVIWSITISGDIINFISASSALITIGGSFCALLISFPMKTLIKIPSMLKLLVASPQDDRQKLVLLFTDLAKKARKDGLLALEDDITIIEDEFLISGLQMIVDGVEPDTIREILELKQETAERRHSTGQAIFSKWGEYAPAFGMVGTLIGLIIMLAKLDDPSAIGIGMATALLTTLYGSLLANLILLPIASNLKVQTDEEMYTGQMIVEGILEIQAGSNPRLLEDKLTTYLSPEEQKLLKAEKENVKEAENYE
ncbi:motility protein A [Alkalibaculum sp. M08DMB]|uniref:Motility protein A n=1 Tax=Alkalibaculum sporogenes TaxID=2655001 RepID=A0A6A7K637_9FIRM|nr:motility protein A [Alkalibaculum sporogenes]MPW24801.1 motility protein A [Alkalibaculum sporogenes]